MCTSRKGTRHSAAATLELLSNPSRAFALIGGGGSRCRTGSAEGVYPGVYVDQAAFLTEEQRARILAENALDLLGLKKENYEPQT